MVHVGSGPAFVNIITGQGCTVNQSVFVSQSTGGYAAGTTTQQSYIPPQHPQLPSSRFTPGRVISHYFCHKLGIECLSAHKPVNVVCLMLYQPLDHTCCPSKSHKKTPFNIKKIIFTLWATSKVLPRNYSPLLMSVILSFYSIHIARVLLT